MHKLFQPKQRNKMALPFSASLYSQKAIVVAIPPYLQHPITSPHAHLILPPRW